MDDKKQIIDLKNPAWKKLITTFHETFKEPITAKLQVLNQFFTGITLESQLWDHFINNYVKKTIVILENKIKTSNLENDKSEEKLAQIKYYNECKTALENILYAKDQKKWQHCLTTILHDISENNCNSFDELKTISKVNNEFYKFIEKNIIFFDKLSDNDNNLPNIKEILFTKTAFINNYAAWEDIMGIFFKDLPAENAANFNEKTISFTCFNYIFGIIMSTFCQKTINSIFENMKEEFSLLFFQKWEAEKGEKINHTISDKEDLSLLSDSDDENQFSAIDSDDENQFSAIDSDDKPFGKTFKNIIKGDYDEINKGTNSVSGVDNTMKTNMQFNKQKWILKIPKLSNFNDYQKNYPPLTINDNDAIVTNHELAANGSDDDDLMQILNSEENNGALNPTPELLSTEQQQEESAIKLVINKFFDNCNSTFNKAIVNNLIKQLNRSYFNDIQAISKMTTMTNNEKSDFKHKASKIYAAAFECLCELFDAQHLKPRIFTPENLEKELQLHSDSYNYRAEDLTIIETKCPKISNYGNQKPNYSWHPDRQVSPADSNIDAVVKTIKENYNKKIICVCTENFLYFYKLFPEIMIIMKNMQVKEFSETTIKLLNTAVYPLGPVPVIEKNKFALQKALIFTIGESNIFNIIKKDFIYLQKLEDNYLNVRFMAALNTGKLRIIDKPLGEINKKILKVKQLFEIVPKDNQFFPVMQEDMNQILLLNDPKEQNFHCNLNRLDKAIKLALFLNPHIENTNQITNLQTFKTTAKKIFDQHILFADAIKEELIITLIAMHQNTDPFQSQKMPLLVGKPGVGKTELAKLMPIIGKNNTEEAFVISISSLKESHELQGTGLSYSRPDCGIIFNNIIRILEKNTNCQKIWIILEELDKMRDVKQNIVAQLTLLLDPKQKAIFSEYFGDYISLYNFINFIGTANCESSNGEHLESDSRLTNIPEEIRNRCNIIYVPEYSDEEKALILEQKIFNNILAKYQISNKISFEPKIGINIINYNNDMDGDNSIRNLEFICERIVFNFFTTNEEIIKIKGPKQIKISDLPQCWSSCQKKLLTTINKKENDRYYQFLTKIEAEFNKIKPFWQPNNKTNCCFPLNYLTITNNPFPIKSKNGKKWEKSNKRITFNNKISTNYFKSLTPEARTKVEKNLAILQQTYPSFFGNHDFKNIFALLPPFFKTLIEQINDGIKIAIRTNNSSLQFLLAENNKKGKQELEYIKSKIIAKICDLVIAKYNLLEEATTTYVDTKTICHGTTKTISTTYSQSSSTTSHSIIDKNKSASASSSTSTSIQNSISQTTGKSSYRLPLDDNKTKRLICLYLNEINRNKDLKNEILENMTPFKNFFYHQYENNFKNQNWT